MQYKDPRITDFIGLENLQYRIQEIQQDMNTQLSWLQYSFGLCSMVKHSDNGISIPVCYVDETTDTQDMRPWLDDSHKSYSFWDLINPEEIEYDTNLSVRRYPALSYNVACIVVVNLDSITTGRRVAKSLVRQRLYKYFHQTLRFSGTFQMQSVYDKDIDQIFEGYDIEDRLILLRDDYAAFRIEANITFKQECALEGINYWSIEGTFIVQ